MDPSATARLEFRRVRREDVDLLADLSADSRVMRFLTGGRPQPRSHVETVVAQYLVEYRRGVAGRWLAHDRTTGDFVGWFGLDSTAELAGVEEPLPAGERELGYRLHARWWGRGLATEGARALVDLGFDELGLRRVFGRTMAVNVASRRVLQNAGLRHVRTFHPEWDDPIPGAEHGEVEYEFVRADRPGTTRPTAP